jgi:hypothetical protein
VIHNLELCLAQDGKNILVSSSPEFRTRPITDNIGVNHMQASLSDKSFKVTHNIYIYIYTHIHTHTNIYTYKHIYTYTYIYIYMLA